MYKYNKVKTGHYFVKCAGCKDKWLENENPNGTYGRNHSCVKLRDLIAKKDHSFEVFTLPRLAHLTKEQQDKERHYKTVMAAYSIAISAEPVLWKKPFGEPTACNGKCLNAKNGDCECKCNGLNHGLNHLR